MEQVVRSIWARVLRIPADTIAPDDRFLAIGGSSLAAMEVLAALEDEFAEPLDPAMLRDCRTVTALADHLLSTGVRPRTAEARVRLDSGDAPARLDSADAPARPRIGEAPARPDIPRPAEASHAHTGPPSAFDGSPGGLAIIGMACRFPEADTPEEFWANLVAGRDSVTPVNRWAGGGHGAFLADPARFDAGYFGIDEDEARLLDPHARIFLELAHEALEHAGYAGPRRHAHRIGVFAAVGESGYPELITTSSRPAGPDTVSAPGQHTDPDTVSTAGQPVSPETVSTSDGSKIGPYALTGTLRNLIAARVAHSLDLHGPALAVDTACSSALVALHLARRSLESGDCDIAVVGGVNLNLTSTGETLLGEAQALSPSGRCRAFAAGADGFVPGEGGAVLVLTRLAEAGDADILAVVRGTAVNNDGRSLSLMAPNPLLQQEVIADAYRTSGVDPAEVTYVEAHGTGTPVGDPIEARSLAHAFPPLPDNRPRLLGSVKTNIGHLLNAAGMPALVKVILALRHRQLPPSLHHDQPSPRFDLAANGFEVVTETRPWQAPHVAGVNGFGFGGTNAHVILAAPPGRPEPANDPDAAASGADQPVATPPITGPEHPEPESHLLTLSARSAASLRTMALDLAAHLRSHPDQRIADVCATVSTARDPGPCRIALVTGKDLPDRLVSVDPPAPLGRPARTVFLFGGQGTQRPGQAAELYRSAPAFRRILDEVSEAAGEVAGRTLVAWCTDPDVTAGELARTEVTQPVVVAFGVAQAAQLIAFGIRPDAVAGHSIGELAAAVTAGHLTAVDAVLLAKERGRLTAALVAPGTMLAVAATVTEIAAVLGDVLRLDAATSPDGVFVAAENAPKRIVLAGSRNAMAHAGELLAAAGVVTRDMAAGHAFHTPAMEPVAQHLAHLAPVPRAGVIPLVSTMTGNWLTDLDGAYLAAQATHPVRFAAAADRLREAGFDTMVEVGASLALSPFVRGTTVLPPASTRAALLATVGTLWQRGADLDRSHLDAGTRRVRIPAYPFQRTRYWIAGDPAPAGPVPGLPLGPAAQPQTSTPTPARMLATAPTGADRSGLPTPTGPVLSVPDWTEAPLAEPRTDGRAPVTVITAGKGGATEALAAINAVPRDGRLLLVTEDLYAAGCGSPRPRHALWAALAMAFADENRAAGVRIIDVSSADSKARRRAAIDHERAGPPTAGPAEIVAWRAGRRLTRTFAPVTGRPEPAGGAEPFSPPPDGSYLIVGGAGAVAAEIARHLARRGRPHLTLTGRSAEPAELLTELRRLGATAEYLVTDVTVPGQVRDLVTGRHFDVVVQAAGVVRPGSLRSKTPGEVNAVLAAKVRGTKLLARAFTARQTAGGSTVPLFVALSSVSSVLPGLAGAVGDYVAGNLFLDSFAAAERAAGRPFVAVNLPALTGAGLAAAHASVADGLPIEQVPELLWAAARLGVPQVLVTAPPASSPESRTLFRTVPSPSGAQPSTQSTPSTAPARPTPGPAAGGGGWGRAALVTVLRQMLAGPLHREPDEIGVDEPFLALGLDSLTAVDLVKDLETRLGRTLSTTLFFEHRTVGELAAHLSGVDTVPFSPVQRAFVTTGRLYPEIPAYAYVRQTLDGPIDTDRLRAAFAELERRHPMTRVRFGADGQRFTAPGRPDWFTVRDGAQPVGQIDAELRNRPFDLSRESPVRAVLAGSDLIVVVHHAVADGFSLAVLGDELWALYQGLDPGPAPVATFADHEAQRTEPSVADLDHWQRELTGWPALTLPFDGDIEDQPQGPYAVRQRALDRETTRRLTEVARTAEVSLFHLLLAGYARCLARWSGQAEVPVSVARAGRAARLPGIDRMVGPFADTLPVLADVRPGESGTELAARLRGRWLDAERHGSVSTVDLARMLAADGTGPRSASPAGFSFARFPGAGATAANVRATTAGTASAATRLGLVCFEAHGTLHFSWNYPESLFTAATVERFADEHLAEITALAVEAAPPVAITAPIAEQAMPVDVVERIREQCRRTPAGIAVLSDGVPLTYHELDLASDRLAARLAIIGTRRIGLLTSPGADTVIGVVGILKAGAAWVPVDASHPPARLSSQLERAGARVVVCDAGTRAVAETIGLPRVGIETVAEDEAVVAPAVRNRADDAAYVIFTSGSTGRPKGVAVSHRAMSNYLHWAITTFGYREDDRLAQTASLCFDASVRQILAPLLVGATVVGWDRDTVRDPERLAERLEHDRVTVWSSVPTLWEHLLTAAEKSHADLSRLRWVHVGGEELSPAHVRRWFALLGPDQRITNLYGPTETTINATWHLIDSCPADDVTRLPIGRPVGGAIVEVVGPDGRPADDGEIYIGGTGLTDGYLDDPEQTAKAFVVRDGTRWYRSGDLGHRDPDGLLWFRGRADDQVKLHGHRIEPAEVEAVLRRHPSVERAAVQVHDARLVAWVQSPSADGSGLRAHLRTLLPEYLIPSRFEIVGELPLTAAGKIDRAALSVTISSSSSPASDEPLTATESLLAGLWRRQLGVAAVSRDDDFFDLGGDSIGVLELFASLAEHRPVLPRPTVLFHNRSLADLAAVIDAHMGRSDSASVGKSAGQDFPVSLTQRGFLLADAVGAPSTWLAAPRLHGPLDRDRFQHAVDVLVARHPMLRTVFPRGARPPVQREIPSVRVTVGYVAEPRPVEEELAAERGHRFDPAEWPLVRLRLLRYAPAEYVLVVHAHHLVGDGYSVALLMRELLAVYDGATLPPLRATFRDYVAMLAGVRPEVVPHARRRLVAGGEITTAGFTLGDGDVAAMRDEAAAAGVTPFVPILAAYRRALAAVTGSRDPVIGLAVTGRDHALTDITRTFGPYATAVAVDIGPGSDAAAGRRGEAGSRIEDDGDKPGRRGEEVGLAELAAAVVEARNRVFTAPGGWQYFFTHLDFGAEAEGETLRLTWEDADAELALPPGTDVLLAVRPVTGGLRLTLRGRLSSGEMERIALFLENSTVKRVPDPGRLDAALVGYLPAPGHLASLAEALPEGIRAVLPHLDRETIRSAIFPGGRPRLLETVRTPLGVSGFVAVPRFADELARPGLAEDAALGVDLAAELGARTVSLAGMIPALTGYGTALTPYRRKGVDLTTGHAVTAAAVVRTTLAAVRSRGRDIGDCVVAILGVGSIGTSSLSLLLATSAPAGLILCDLPASAARLTELAATVEIPVETATDGPEAIYRADVIIAATSGGPSTVDVDRLKPGTILVDDSFPHCFDTAKAMARMRERGDVLIVGGGLLGIGHARRSAAEGLPAVNAHLPDTVASCQLESLLHATRPGLPAVSGPVEPGHARAYWDALDAAGVTAAPLHLLNQRFDSEGDVEPIAGAGIA
ncbi:amino acid adenylation domain-containing protein [Actinoplanes sp. G11-F43]|uniref:amino acid adenylation domain-containing protein n=1 Tax=Actinoplanes sp. G11-F43 TaxID=3424130 RepID=UPI003D342677